MTTNAPNRRLEQAPTTATAAKSLAQGAVMEALVDYQATNDTTEDGFAPTTSNSFLSEHH